MEIITIPIITTIVYTVIEVVKTATKNPDILKRFTPMLACVLGVICSLIAYFFVPDVLPTDNGIIAAVIGGASGLASTGVYENIKNLFKKVGE